MNHRQSARNALYLLFTVSGFSGLIYESIWSHYLKLFLGHAAYAQTLVLAIFMGGMAIGSWAVASRAARIPNLLLAYAIVEVLIGLLGLVFDPLFRGITQWTFSSLLPSLGSPAAIQLTKWLIAALLIAPQSVLLGATFPLMSGAIVRRHPASSGQTIAMLYFTNSLGAAAGVLVSGFYLVGAVGLPGTILTAGLLNVALALVVWAITKRSPDEAPYVAEMRGATPAPEPPRLARLLQLGAFATGAAAFLYEIAWLRMLALVLGSSTHAFELMLSAFILGIALGGLWIRGRIQRLADPVRTLGRVLLVMSAIALASLYLYQASFDWMAQIVAMFTPTEAGYVGYNLGSHAIAIALMVPTTFLCGLTLPIMTHLLLGTRAGERAIGSIYGWNTIGAIVGVVLATHVAMPLLGVKAVLIAGAALQAGLGLMYLAFQRRSPWLADGGYIAAAACAVLAALALHLDPGRLASGVYRHGHAGFPPGTQVTYYRDGVTASISLVENAGSVSIATNGKPDATIDMRSPVASPDEVTMVMAGALPLAIHASPRTVANIGIGSGLTTHVLLQDPALTSVDTIEIEPFMIDAARRGFFDRVSRAFTDPRSHIHVEDAKTFFATHRRRYDVIVSEPSNPWVSGVASLFSVEFYRDVKPFLQPGGLFVQWLQIYETDLSTVSSVLKAVSMQFSDFALYRTDDSNVLIIAVPEGRVPPIDPGRLFAGDRKAALERVGIATPRDVESRFVGDRGLLLPAIVSVPAPANSDYFPFVDQNAVKARILKRDAVDVVRLASRPVPVLDLLRRTGPREDALSPGRPELLYLDGLAVRAGQVYAALTRPADAAGLPADLAAALALITAPAQSCANPSIRLAWHDAAFRWATIVSPVLTRGQLEEFWATLRRQPCALQLDPERGRFLAFETAVSLRNVAEVHRLGLELLASSAAAFTGAEQYSYAAQATAAAALAERKPDDARQILAALEASVGGAGLHTWDLLVLDSLARVAATPTR